MLLFIFFNVIHFLSVFFWQVNVGTVKDMATWPHRLQDMPHLHAPTLSLFVEPSWYAISSPFVTAAPLLSRRETTVLFPTPTVEVDIPVLPHLPRWLVSGAGVHPVHPSLIVFLCWTLPSICHQTYFHYSKGHVTWIIKKVNKIPTHCVVVYESVCSLVWGHVIRVCFSWMVR